LPEIGSFTDSDGAATVSASETSCAGFLPSLLALHNSVDLGTMVKPLLLEKRE